MGGKRVLLSNDFYPALTQPHVSLVTDGIAEIRDKSIVTRDGSEREVDTITFGTGFHVTDLPVRRGGSPTPKGCRSPSTGLPGPDAFRGTTTPGFPNLFVLTGPNTGLGTTPMSS